MRKKAAAIGVMLLLLLFLFPGMGAEANDEAERGQAKVPARSGVAGGWFDRGPLDWSAEMWLQRARHMVRTNPFPALTDEECEWIRRHDRSQDPIDQALIRYWREYERNLTPEEPFMSVFPTPSAEKALRHLVELGPEYVDEMLARIEAGGPWQMQLRYAVNAGAGGVIVQSRAIRSFRR